MDRCRVVLVRTQIAANLGSVARLVRNFGAGELVLVAPEADRLDANARQTATRHADDLLESCRVVETLDAAVADCLLTAGASARVGGLYRRQTVGAPDEIVARLVETMSSGRVALVFGPESTGLSNEEVQRCQLLIRIPTCEDNPALNLAQAAAVCLYELRRTWLRRQHGPAPSQDRADPEQQARMFEQFKSGLEEIHYLRGVRGEALMHAFRHLIARAQPSAMEVRLLQGLARQLGWVARRANLDFEGDKGFDEEA